LQTKTKIVSCHTADSKPVKQEVNGTVILPPLVFLAPTDKMFSPKVDHLKNFGSKFTGNIGKLDRL
jgi:hypothetical protein